MKTMLAFAILAMLVLLTPGWCFADWRITQVSNEQAQELGMEIRSTPVGPNEMRVEFEFAPEGKLKSYSRVDLRIHEGTELLVAAPLREVHPHPDRVVVGFLASRAHLDKIKLWVMVPDSIPGGSIYEVRVQEFVEDKPQALDETSENPLAPEMILEKNFEGQATVELEVGEVHILNIDALFVPDVSHALQINAKIPGAKIGQQVLVIVSREVATRLLKLGIADPAEHFRGKILRVSGTVELLRRPSAPRPASNPAGAPSQMLYRIRVTNLDQLESIRIP